MRSTGRQQTAVFQCMHAALDCYFTLCWGTDRSLSERSVASLPQHRHCPDLRVQVKSEMHVRVLLWFHGYCTQTVGSRWTDSQSILLQRHSWKTQKESHMGSSKHCHKLDPSPRQCASPCSVLCSAVFYIQRHYGDAAASLLTWSHALRLLISKSKIGNERTPFWVNRRHPEVCNAGLKRHSSSCVPGMLQTVAAPLENVCAGTRHALWRWQYWWIIKIKHFFGTNLVTLLSDLVYVWIRHGLTTCIQTEKTHSRFLATRQSLIPAFWGFPIDFLSFCW